MTAAAKTKGPLDGIHVLEIAHFIAGPHAAMILCDHGADVIKIEPPEGDWGRLLGELKGDHCAHSVAFNRGKRSIALDLKSPDGIAVVKKIAAKAPEAAKPSVPTMVEIRSECSKTVDVFLGEKPKFGSGTKTQVSGNSTSTRGRKADGTLTVWLIDDKENGIASVNVTPETKRVVIGSSCKDITAR